MIAIACCLLLLVLTACNGGGDLKATPDPPPTVDAQSVSPGGFWVGTESTGGDVLVIVTESGYFHYLTLDTFTQGNGVLRVSEGNQIAGEFKLVTQPGFIYPDRSTRADCAFAGTVAERESMTMYMGCTTTGGMVLNASAVLSYDADYERDSSLATIAGNYQDESSVLNIAGDGTIFRQDSETGCVVNGQVDIFNNAFNTYEVLFSYSDCTEQSEILNGSIFYGIAILDNSVVPEILIIATTGNVEGVFISNYLAVERS